MRRSPTGSPMPTLVKPATTMEFASEEDPTKAEAAEDPTDVGAVPEEQARAQFLADFLVIHARYDVSDTNSPDW